MAEKVIVAVNGGPASTAALAWAVDRVRGTDLELEITTVVDLEAALPPEAVTVFRKGAEEVLAEARDAAAAGIPQGVVTTNLRSGWPHEQLIDASRHANLVVVGTNRTSPIVGIVHGTLALKVAGQASCVTVVVPVDWRANSGDVVVGWTDDATAEAALEFAAGEASRTHRGLTIVHTWGAIAPADVSGATIVVQELIAANRQLLADAADRVRRDYPTLTVTQLLHAGSAAVAIVRAAETASLVVVGSRGRGAVAGFFLGSVSHDVLMNMPAPVAVVPRVHEPVEVYPELVEEDL